MTERLNTAEGTLWRWVEDQIRRVVYRYGYQEIRLPILESAALYAPGTAGETDADIMLRPEGTLGCVKAVVDARTPGRHDAQRLWYQGPMFRQGNDGPQQFHQFGVEAYGMSGAELDAELILLSRDIFSALGLNRRVSLEINTLGTWREQKEGGSAHLNLESRLHFSTLCHLLDSAGMTYQINPAMTEGIGYYTRTVYDWKLNDPEAQRLSLCSGGRYDELTGRCCGQLLAASGFAIDFESVLQCVQQDVNLGRDNQPQVVLICEDPESTVASVLLSQRLRRQLPALIVRNDLPASFPADPQPDAQWVVTLNAAGRARVWSKEDARHKEVALAQVVDLIAGRLPAQP